MARNDANFVTFFVMAETYEASCEDIGEGKGPRSKVQVKRGFAPMDPRGTGQVWTNISQCLGLDLGSDLFLDKAGVGG